MFQLPMFRSFPNRAWRLFAASVVLCGLAAGAAPLHAAEPPAMAQPLQLSKLALAPDGEAIAGQLTVDGMSAVFVQTKRSEPAKPILKLDSAGVKLRWLHWVSDDRLLASVHSSSTSNGTLFDRTRLFSLRRDGSGLIDLSESPFDKKEGALTQFADRIVDWLPGDGRHVLVEMPARAGATSPAVFRVDVETGERALVHGAVANVLHWLTDANHRVRVGVHRVGADYEIQICDPDGSHWRTAWRFEKFSRETIWPLGFGKDPDELYVQANHEGRKALFTVSLKDPKLPLVLKLDNAEGDLDGALLRSADSGEVVGLTVRLPGAQREELWAPAFRQLAATVDQALPGRFNRFREFSRDDSRYLVYSSGNGVPGEYYLGDRRSGRLMLLGGEVGPGNASRYAEKQAIKIRSRDGLSLNAYLTMPLGAPADQPLPMVLLPHGGPIDQDDEDFDPLTAFLSQHGYAVLQVNFRGSSGQGHAFMSAGLRRWGLEMQDDLTDAVSWAVDKKVADPRRVCIVGASYGGYAALMGAVKTPDLYRCAVSASGVTHLPEMIEHSTNFVDQEEELGKQIGGFWRDRERLIATSPALQAQRIKVPVLLVHGTLDTVVPIAQSEAMDKALKEAGKPHSFIVVRDGDHSVALTPRFFTALEKFLQTNLAPLPDPMPPTAP